MTLPATQPPPVPPPTTAEVRAWLKVSTTALSDADLNVIRNAELSNQDKVCRVPADLRTAGLLPAELAATIYRRCARAVAARGIPLGYRSGDDEFGPTRLPSYDGEINRLERPWRKFVFA